MAEDQAGPTAVVLAEMRHCFPEPVEKGGLLERTGLTPEEARAALDELMAEGMVQPHGAGAQFILAARGVGEGLADRSIPEGAQTAEAAERWAQMAGGEPGAQPEEAEEPAEPVVATYGGPYDVWGVPDARTRYSALLTVQVDFYPEREDGETEDAAAAREAKMLADMASGAIRGDFPGLPVVAAVDRLTAFGQVREVPVG